MKEHLLYVLSILIIFGGCNYTKNNNNISSVDDKILAENEEYQILLHDEAIADSIEGLPSIKQVSLWVFDKKQEQRKKILLSHPEADGSWFSMEHAVSIPLDSIPTIQNAKILSWKGKSLKILVEGCSDYRNVQSFIIEENKDSAICLPTNRGLIGISEEDRLLIMQSYEYYEDGGRYNIIEAFDLNGNRISSMEAKIH